MNDYCVYMHKNKINGKIYIGITNDPKRRWKNGGIEYKPHDGRITERPFWNAICKYGFDNFEHIIIENNLTKEEAFEKEKYYISKYKSRERNIGYNIACGGNGGKIYIEHPKGMKNKHHTKEWGEEHSKHIKEAAKRGAYKNMWKEKEHPRGMLGKHHTEEFKQKLRSIPTDEHPSAKKVEIIYPDGTIKKYGSFKSLCIDKGIGKGVARRIIKSNKPYYIPKSCHSNLENLKKIEGCIIKYIENTEITS